MLVAVSDMPCVRLSLLVLSSTYEFVPGINDRDQSRTLSLVPGEYKDLGFLISTAYSLSVVELDADGRKNRRRYVNKVVESC